MFTSTIITQICLCIIECTLYNVCTYNSSLEISVFVRLSSFGLDRHLFPDSTFKIASVYYVIFLQRTLWPTYYKRKALLWTKNMYLHVMYLRKMWNCTRAKKVTHSHTFCLQNGFYLCLTFTLYVDFIIIIITKRAWNLARQEQISANASH